MKKNVSEVACKAKLCLAIGAILAVFAGCNNDMQQAEVSKELKISTMGFAATAYSPLVPGQTVEVYARANKRTGVIYTWDVAGSWKEAGNGRISWTVPKDEGEYTITVTAQDEASQQFATRSSTITVLGEAALAAPDTFACTSITKTTLVNRLVGEQQTTTRSKIDMRSDGSVYVETTEADGSTTRTLSDAESVYDVDASGNKRLVARSMEQESSAPAAQLVSLSALKEACSDWTTDGRYYRFSQAAAGSSAQVTYDANLGVLTRVRTEQDDGSEVSDVTMRYKVIDGFTVPVEISGTVKYVLAGEPYTVQVVQTLENIVINGAPVEQADY